MSSEPIDIRAFCADSEYNIVDINILISGSNRLLALLAGIDDWNNEMSTSLMIMYSYLLFELDFLNIFVSGGKAVYSSTVDYFLN